MAQQLRCNKNEMDKIWDSNPSKSEVIGRCGEDEKTIDYAELTKGQMQKEKEKKSGRLS